MITRGSEMNLQFPSNQRRKDGEKDKDSNTMNILASSENIRIQSLYIPQ